MDWGIIGSVLGVLGGVIGTLYSIANARSAAERSFVIKCAIVCWIAVSTFLALLFLLPKPFAWLIGVPYGIGLLFAIPWINTKQARIREREDRNPK